MQLPAIDDCARQMHNTWLRERVTAQDTWVLSKVTPELNMVIPWGDLPEADKEVYRACVRTVYAAISRINLKHAED